MKRVRVALDKRRMGEMLFVTFSDGSVEMYNIIDLGCKWFQMSNDAFYKMYDFSFTPHEYGVYERCRNLVHGKFA